MYLSTLPIRNPQKDILNYLRRPLGAGNEEYNRSGAKTSRLAQDPPRNIDRWRNVQLPAGRYDNPRGGPAAMQATTASRRSIPVVFPEDARLSGTFTGDIKMKRRAERRAGVLDDLDVASQDTVGDEQPPAADKRTARGTDGISSKRQVRAQSGTSVAADDVLCTALAGTGLDLYDQALRRHLNLRIIPVEADGNCMFSAAALQLFGDPAQWRRVRDAVTSYMRGEYDERGAAVETRSYFKDIVMTEAFPGLEGKPDAFRDIIFDRYLDVMAQKGWGGVPELLAMEELYDRPVQIFQPPPPDADVGVPQPSTIHFSGELPEAVSLVTPLRFLYRDGCHYDALLSANDCAVVKTYASIEAAYGDDWEDMEASTSDPDEDNTDDPHGMVSVVFRVPYVQRIVSRRNFDELVPEDDESAAELSDAVPDPPAYPPLQAAVMAGKMWVRLWLTTAAPRSSSDVRRLRERRLKASA